MAYVFDYINNTLIDDEDKSLGNKLAVLDSDLEKVLQELNEKFGPGTIQQGTQGIPQPEKKIPQAIFEFEERMKGRMAKGGRLKAAFPLLAPALLPYAAAFLGTAATGLGLQRQIQNYFENNPDAIDKFKDYVSKSIGYTGEGQVFGPDDKDRKEAEPIILSTPIETEGIKDYRESFGDDELAKSLLKTKPEIFPAGENIKPVVEGFPADTEQLPIIFENKKTDLKDLKKDFDNKSWVDTTIVTGSPAQGTRKSVGQKTNVPFFKKLDKYSQDYHGGNLKSAVKEISGIEVKKGERNNKLESLYTTIQNAAERSDFKFDTKSDILQSDIKQSKALLKFPDLTNRLRTDSSVVDNRIKELKIDTNKIFNRAETQDILGLDRSNKRQNMFFAEVLKDQGIKVENLPGGRQGYKLKDVLIALNDYSKNKLRNYESRKYASNLKKKSSENYELRSEVDGVDFVRLNSQINKSINKTLGKNDLYFPDSVGQIGHNPVPVTFYEKIEMFRDKKLADKVFNIQNYTWQGKEINYDTLAQTSGKLEAAFKKLNKFYGKKITEKNIGDVEEAADEVREYFNTAAESASGVAKKLPFHKDVIGQIVVSVPEIGDTLTADNFTVDMSNVDPRFIIGNVDLINPNAVKYKDLSKEEKIIYGQNIIDQKSEQLKEFYGPEGANYPPEIIEDLIEQFEFGDAEAIGAYERKNLGFKSGGGVEITSLPRVNFGNGGAAGADENFLKELEFYFTNEDAELPKAQTYKETMNPIEVLNDIIDPRNYPYYADVLARSGLRIGEFALRILPATGKLIYDITNKGPFKITGGSGNNYVQDYTDVLPSNIRGTGIFSEFLQNITPTSLEKKVGLDKLIKAEEQKQIERGSTAGPKVFADTVGLGAEVTAPIFPGLKLLNAFAKARNLPNDKVTQKILEKEVDKVLSEKGMNRREFLQATGATATVVMAKMLGLMDVAPKVAKVARAAPVMDNTVQGMPAWFKDAVYAIERKGLLKSRGDIKGVEPDFFEITLDTKLGKKTVLMSKNDRSGEITLDWTTNYYDMDIPVSITYRPGQSGKQNFLSDPEFAQSVEKYDVEVEAPEFQYQTVDTRSMGFEDTSFDSSVNLDIKEEADAVVEALEDLGLGLSKKQKKEAAENFRYYNEVELDEGSGPDTKNPIDENDAFPFLDEIKRNK